ncbi:MSHA biogenesis protein MshP [Vibrio sinensis]|uniref:MSHA biogenesis protein MshP n=1 Tax=Vibrio sinensis TaxID=2302434 RepID=A0A3A6QDS0_9VIBR|nr:MSHA biogenesis protein MshP [Vibrio sinensis]RJX70688.1 MSHA biogenesis protein MshP [Vibrio sinensis]
MYHNSQKQNGSIYVVIIFVLVVMGFLATALTRIQWSNSEAHSRDVLGTQAWLLAQSVNEYTLTRFYPLNDATPVTIDEQCKTPLSLSIVNGAQTLFEPVTLNCELVSLNCASVGQLDNKKYFKLSSRVACGSGTLQTERAEDIWLMESIQ